MKSYINPQPYAVDRIDKTQNNLVKSKKYASLKYNKSTKEIYTNESEEQAWKDVIKKYNPNQKFQY